MACYGLLVVMWCAASGSILPVDSLCKLERPAYLGEVGVSRGVAQWKAICKGE